MICVQVTPSQRGAVVIYRHSDITDELHHIGGNCSPRNLAASEVTSRTRPDHVPDKSIAQNGAICSLLVVIDHTYFEVMAGSDRGTAVARVTQHVSSADFSFRASDIDLDGAPDDIGFRIDRFDIYTSPESEDYRMRDSSVNREDLMNQFCGYNFDEFCLAVAFTYRDFGQLRSFLIVFPVVKVVL